MIMSYRTLLTHILLTLATTSSLYPFKTFSDITAFTARYPEYPDNDQELITVTSPTQVSFDLFLTEISPSWWQRITEHIGLTTSLWNFTDFEMRLHRVFLRESQKLKNRIDHTMVCTQAATEQPLRYLIFGNIAGGVHSLQRILAHMIAEKILDTNLVVQDPHTQLLFLGDIIGASPYNLETLDSILLILERNPERATYIRGWSESNQRWQAFPITAELPLKSGYGAQKVREVIGHLDEFFSMLPCAYLMVDAQKHTALLWAQKEIRDALSPTQINQCTTKLVPNSPTLCTVLSKTPSTTNSPSGVQVIAKFSTTIFNETYYSMSLLHIFAKNKETPVWHLISGTTGIYRALYRLQEEGYFSYTLSSQEFDRSRLTVIGREISDDSSFTVQDKLLIDNPQNKLHSKQ